MSIVVNQLSKAFGKKTVVQQLSFQVAKGQIVGFLGPNGAGKSTTMKILTGYLRPSQGTASICGHDISKQPQKAKKHLGYLAEHNPLYLDMYVHEYLCFMGRIHGMNRTQCNQKAKELIQKCGITAIQNKKISKLSKGYRQRIGLAQALLHDPAVLILDEPTTGLDPNQLREIRALIQEASQEKAVMLSTHLMQEVKALCDRVLLIRQGKVILNATLAQLTAQSNAPLVVTFKQAIQPEALAKLPGVKHIQVLSDQQYLLWSSKPTALREVLFLFAQENKVVLLGLEQKKDTLEDLFHRLTGPYPNIMPT